MPASTASFPSAASWTHALQHDLPDWRHVRWVEQTPSTNPDVQALLLSSHDPDARYLVGAHHQTAGRGRGGKDWATQPGEALLFSCGWVTALALDRLPAFTLVAGLMAAQALDSASATRIQLKWPNDLYTQHGKLAGILAETLRLPQFSAQPPQRGLVLGIGINVSQGVRLSEALERPIGDLARIGLAHSPTASVQRIAHRWDQALRQFEQEGFAPFMDAYRERDWLLGKRIVVSDAHPLADSSSPTNAAFSSAAAYPGEAAGVDENGYLCVQTDGGILRFHTGHIVLQEAS